MSDQPNDLLGSILSGQNRKLQVLAAQGLVPLAPEQLVPIQIALTQSPDAEISTASAKSLAEGDTELLIDFVNQHARDRELLYLGQVPNARVAEAVLRRRDVPRTVLVSLAEVVPPPLQEVLVLRQDAILEEPQILVALERNPQLSSYAKRRAWEYREHLLPRDRLAPKKAEEILAEVESITEEEMAEAVAEVREKAPAEGEEPLDEKHKLTPAQVRLMTVPMRVKLARTADRQMRMLLVRDANSMVATTVVTANSIPDSEVEQIANSRAAHEDVLKAISKKREWIRKYSVARALVKNPKTPIMISVKLVPRMTVRDLRDLSKDKNIPDGVRSTARRLYLNKR